MNIEEQFSSLEILINEYNARMIEDIGTPPLFNVHYERALGAIDVFKKIIVDSPNLIEQYKDMIARLEKSISESYKKALDIYHRGSR